MPAQPFDLEDLPDLLIVQHAQGRSRSDEIKVIVPFVEVFVVFNQIDLSKSRPRQFESVTGIIVSTQPGF